MWISHVASKTLSAHADPTTPAGEDGFSGRLLPRPPTAFPLWQEGRLQRETIEACSGFTCFSACAFAPRLHRGLPRRLQPDDCSSSAAPVATGRTDNSPGGTCTRWPSRPRRSLRNLTTQLTSVLLPCRTAILFRADLHLCCLRGADLREIAAEAINLRQANLRDTEMLRSNLRLADLRGADLAGAHLWKADLTGADLTGASVSAEQFASTSNPGSSPRENRS
jgi:hypothetical protein